MAWTRRRGWLVGLTVGWAVLLAGAAYYSARTGTPTARDQTSVADARPVVDRTVADLVRAGAAAQAVVAVGPFARLGGCRISAVRDGERWEQAVSLFTRPGGESALLERLAADLPADYGARVRPRAGVPTLRADAGSFVGVSGSAATRGEVRLTVATGCRAVSEVAPVTSDVPAASRAPLDAPLGALRLRPARWSTFDVPCPAGGRVTVVAADGEPGVVPVPLPGALAAVGPDPAVADADRYAYRSGPTSVVARVGEAGVSLTATTPCQ